MTNGSNKLNRHGIPLLGEEPKPCIWPRCPMAAAKDLRLPICRGHARQAFTAISNERAISEREYAEQRRLEREQNQVIYYLRVSANIKIGWTTRLDERMRSYAPDSSLLAVHPGTRADERKLHQRFATHRAYGNEWYTLNPMLLEHIKRMVAEHGEPPTITFGAKPVEVPRPMQQKTKIGRRSGPRLIA